MLKGIYLRLCYYSSYQNEHITNRYVKIVHIFQCVYLSFIFLYLLSKLAKNSLAKSLYLGKTAITNKIIPVQKTLAFKYFILISSLLFIILLSLTKAEAAINAKTSKAINGSLPYITFDQDGKVEVTKSSDILSIKINLPGVKNTYVPQSGSIANSVVDTSSAENPIELPKDFKFSQVETLIPFGNYPSVPLNTVLGAPNNYWRDMDGDTNFSAIGNLNIKWQDNLGTDITSQVKQDPYKLLDPCDSPYKLTLAVTNVKFATNYGVPKESNLVASSHDYYLRPAVDRRYVCYARPSLNYDSTTNRSLNDVDGSDWVAGKGFKPSSEGIQNFPSTGADNLYFDLILAGVTAKEVIDGYPGGTVKFSIGGNVFKPVSLKLSIPTGQDTNTSNQLRVTMIGPNEGVKTVRNKMFVATGFRIYHKDSNTLLYEFVINRWYMLITKSYSSIDELKKFCLKQGFEGIVYSIPSISDLTNANAYTWDAGIEGRKINNYRRTECFSLSLTRRTGGLFNEWGFLSEENYPGIGWSGDTYLTQSMYDGDKRYFVSARDGSILKQEEASSNYKQVCVAPHNRTDEETKELNK